jgi:hypothetical protein
MKSLFSSKKAEAEEQTYFYMVLFQIGMLAVIGGFVLFFVNAEVESTSLARYYLSRDMSIDLSAVQGVPGNLWEYYKFPMLPHLFKDSDFLKLDLSFDKNLVNVQGKSYPYSNSLFFKTVLASENSASFIHLWNNAYNLYSTDALSKKDFLRLEKLKYPYAGASDWKTKQAVIAPETEPAVKAFYNKYQGQLNLKKDVSENTSVYLELRFDNSSNLIAEIPYSSAVESRKLASILVNMFIDSLSEDKKLGKAYVRITETKSSADSYVVLNIGNSLGFKISEISSIVFDSLEEYSR